MVVALTILIILASLAILHTYLVFPWYIKWRSARTARLLHVTESQPEVSVLIAAHNEESVIGEKLSSIFNTSYPLHKIKVYVGSDVSTDNTTQIVKEWKQHYPQIHLVDFKSRQGKPAIINQLAEMSIYETTGEHILVLTDANVFFESGLIESLVAHNTAEDVGLVAANARFKLAENATGVSRTENTYNDRELEIKYAEGKIWGTMMGPFGACFSVRSDLWKPVPEGYIVDDFWTNMSVLQQDYKTVLAQTALAYEYTVDDAQVEYQRKVRMSTGNLQNLIYFRKLLYSSRAGLSFSFWSHKVLRWVTPILLLLIYVSLWVLFFLGVKLNTPLIVLHLILLLCGMDFWWEKKEIRTGALRSLRHFLMMNIAMLEGYRNYFKHNVSAIWNPTARVSKN